MGWVTADAPTRQELDACISCGLCLPVCPTFRLTGDEAASPRGRLAAMSAVSEDELAVDEVFAEAMGFCLQCRACEVVCPSMVPFGRAMEGARIEIAAQLPTRGRAVRRTLVGKTLASRGSVRSATVGAAIAQRLRLDGALPGPLARMKGMRPVGLGGASSVGIVAEPDGEVVGSVGLLAGCVMDAWFNPVHVATIELLRRAGYRVEVPKAQTCCGALAAHDGAADEARSLARRNTAAFADYDLVVSDAAGCTAHLKELQHWAADGSALGERVRDATELIASLIEEGRLPMLEADRGEVAVQDPCHLRHAQRIVAEPRRILRAAGYTPVEIDPIGMCCGAAGVYMVLHPETSDVLGMQKADQVRAAGPALVASANPGCEMQLRSHLGPDFRIAHPVELYHEALLDA
ncbi:MAG TPA: (Fe-S)-binding protein [Acidimicrobiia bacterium]|jgi:glycolate oxidase iron-sulfur subunit|nr:(Fe-S)-binding protein [Acidimicrobiia bacterium]